MAPDKLSPSDSRVAHRTAQVNGKTYHYLFGEPIGKAVGTVLLIHGFPDLSLGWRYQVPLLLSLGYRFIVPDTLGYGQTDAPEALEAYSLKSMAADMAALVSQVVPGERIVLGGHDWGGALVWRIALWHPELIRAVISVCTPFHSPRGEWVDHEAYFQMLPNFNYQQQFMGPDLEANIVGKDRIRQFLNALYGGRTPNREPCFTTEKGVLIDKLDEIQPTPLLSPEEMDFYVDEFDRHGLRGPLNWYRTRRMNFEEELALVEKGQTRIQVPSMFILASMDKALPLAMAQHMDRYFDSLVRQEVNASHWALWQAAEDTNRYIEEFLTGLSKGRGGFKAQI